jgi:hypothetical protein
MYFSNLKLASYWKMLETAKPIPQFFCHGAGFLFNNATC